ncbi:nuclear transport factor 2 [Nelusetta ayraudi]|uniref:nuclear transport factor 2 n=1 Tax=Nelusetta ayraudi TaxID=303726 RepID=UPI003F713129
MQPETPMYHLVGCGFVDYYYNLFDNDRVKLKDLYDDSSCLSFEGEQFVGKTAIFNKLASLPFKQIKHVITVQDHQPTSDSSILCMVVGQLQADDEKIIGFQQCFLLKNVGMSWIIKNDMFRLSLYNHV